jgi:hexosaminidase
MINLFHTNHVSYPAMTEKGAYDKQHIYSQGDIDDLIEFDRQRGIRVFVEFDSPGHTRSWGKSLDLLTKCYNGEQPTNHYGPMDPSRNTTFHFLKNFFTEIADVFPDHYIHLGGDEVKFDCW